MAVFWNVILSFLGFLLTVDCFGGDITTSGFDCTTGNVCSCDPESCRSVTCRNIDTEEKARCAQQNLRELQVSVSFTQLHFNESELEFLPDDFLESYPLTSLIFSDCRITQIPQRLIAPVCGTLRKLVVYFNQELRSIGESTFGECEGLKKLDLSFNGIVEVSPKAFLGLSNLEELELGENNIVAFNGLEGIPRLKQLFLYFTDVRYLPKNAFQKLSSLQIINMKDNKLTTLEDGTLDSLTDLKSIYLSGNPLNCDCSLKWFQDWSKTLYVDTSFECGLEQILLKDMDLSYCPPVRKPMNDGSTGHASRDSATDVTVFMSVLALAMKYFHVI